MIWNVQEEYSGEVNFSVAAPSHASVMGITLHSHANGKTATPVVISE
jgi:hypothetical protein